MIALLHKEEKVANPKNCTLQDWNWFLYTIIFIILFLLKILEQWIQQFVGLITVIMVKLTMNPWFTF